MEKEASPAIRQQDVSEVSRSAPIKEYLFFEVTGNLSGHQEEAF